MRNDQVDNDTIGMVISRTTAPEAPRPCGRSS
jgi:hypothetical protein